MGNMREASKKHWHSSDTIQEINAGSLQRIADATELMAGNYIKLQKQKDMYEDWCEKRRVETVKLYRRISALQGVITKLKKKQCAIK